MGGGGGDDEGVGGLQVKRRDWVENGRNAPGEEQGGELAKRVVARVTDFGFALGVGAMELVGASSIFETRRWYRGSGVRRGG